MMRRMVKAAMTRIQQRAMVVATDVNLSAVETEFKTQRSAVMMGIA